MNDDPMQYSCQQNFTIMTTDGYWSGYDGKKIDASKMDNQDSDSTKVARPIWDGATDGGAQDPDGTGTTYSAKGTLADVALYYYQTDLRPSRLHRRAGSRRGDGQRAQPARPVGNQLEPEDAQQAAHDHLRPGHGRRPDGLAAGLRVGHHRRLLQRAQGRAQRLQLGIRDLQLAGARRFASRPPTWTTCGTPP